MEKLYRLVIDEISYLGVFVGFVFSPNYRTALVTCMIGFGLLYLYDHPGLVIKYYDSLVKMVDSLIELVFKIYK